MENNLIPFDLEKAKAGKPVVYRNGEVPDELFFSKKKQCFISFNNYDLLLHNDYGVYGRDPDYDLFMSEEEMYVVVFKDGSVFLYNELDRAKAYARNLANCKGTYKLVKI